MIFRLLDHFCLKIIHSVHNIWKASKYVWQWRPMGKINWRDKVANTRRLSLPLNSHKFFSWQTDSISLFLILKVLYKGSMDSDVPCKHKRCFLLFIRSVSYTHLDVYKRQRLGSSQSLKDYFKYVSQPNFSVRCQKVVNSYIVVFSYSVTQEVVNNRFKGFPSFFSFPSIKGLNS